MTAGRALLAAVVALPLAATLAVAPARPAAADDHIARLELTRLDPAVGEPGTTLTAGGTVTVSGDRALRDVQVRLRVSRTRLNSRGEMGPVAAGRTTSRDGDVVAERSLAGRLRPGQAVPFEVAVRLDDVEVLQDFGVHVLGVEVLGDDGEGLRRLTITRTFLPWVPRKRDFEPTGFAWVWPLVGAPSRMADGTYQDDRLAVETAPDGRLGRLAAAGARLGQQVPLTWMVDPALLDTAADMTGGYRVRSAAGGGAVDGLGADTASQWLDQVRAASALGSVVTLPYGDPDLVALHRHGMTDAIVAARARGAATVHDLLDRPVVTDVGWPADGFSDGGTLRDLRGFGMAATVLDARALPPELDLPFTPAGRADLVTRRGRIAALLADPVLSQVLDSRDDPLLAGQRFVAETAMITAELPGTGGDRTVLVVPPRRWDPPAELLSRVVGVSLQAPWMRATSVGDLRAAPPAEIDRERLSYPQAVRRRELPGPYLTAVQDVAGQVGTFASVLTEPTRERPALDAAVYRLRSTWWRDRDERLRWLVGSRRHLLALTDRIQVLPGSYTFGSRSGTIPLTVSNDLDQAVTVDISLVPSPPRLRIGGVDPVRIAAESKVQVEVPATSVANGPVLVRTVLRTPEGQPFGDPVELRVQVTEYGTVALIITAAAAAVLFAAAGFRLVRRAAAARRSRPEPV